MDPRDAEGALVLPALLTEEELTKPGTHTPPTEPPQERWMSVTETVITVLLMVIVVLIGYNLWRIFSL